MIPPKILALIPAYNEAAAIREVITRVSVHLPVLVVDDGSRDETANIAEAAGARVLRQAPNQGKGTALRAGFRQALDEQFDAVLTLDADGQHDPAEIPLFLEAFRQNQAHLVIGQRTFKEMPLVRRLANTLNVSFPGVDAQALAMNLDLLGFCVSTGSACATAGREPSHVLTAMGCGTELAAGALRLSLTRDNQADDIEQLGRVLPAVVARLKSS